MNGILTGQLVFFLALGAFLIVASLQLSGDYDFIAEIRGQLTYGSS